MSSILKRLRDVPIPIASKKLSSEQVALTRSVNENTPRTSARSILEKLHGVNKVEEEVNVPVEIVEPVDEPSQIEELPSSLINNDAVADNLETPSRVNEKWETAEDAARHYKGLSKHEAEIWLAAANNAYEYKKGEGGTKSQCDEYAIRVANAAVNKQREKNK